MVSPCPWETPFPTGLSAMNPVTFARALCSPLSFLMRVVLFLGTGLTLLSGEGHSATATANLLVPADGAVLRDTLQTFAWEPLQADRIELWVDGICLGRLPGDTTSHVPFPLSYGAHEWHLVVERAGVRQKSAPRRFRVQDAPLAKLPEGAVLLRENWHVQAAAVVGKEGRALSSGETSLEGWSRSSVPTTVLSALVRNGVYPNPYVGMNNMLIPDSDDDTNKRHDLLKHSHLPGRNPWSGPYWFVTSFEVPKSYAGRRVYLNLGEINYRAEVWLNGSPVAGHTVLVGMDRSFRLDVTAQARVGKANHLAIAIHPVDLPGEPAAPSVSTLAEPGRNMGQDGLICMNYTRWDLLGWDWQAPVRDRAMGITEDVFLECGGDVDIEDLHVAPQLTLGEKPLAELIMELECRNHSDKAVKGKLEGVLIEEGGRRIPFVLPVTLPPGVSTRLVLDPAQVPELRLASPRLWWPAGMGAQALYRAELKLVVSRKVAATRSCTFGIRKVDTLLRDGNRVFLVNGRELFLQGGNWVNDMMFTWSASRYGHEVGMALAANLNFLRVWGPNGVPPEAFFDEADRRGLLVWQDFLHDHWGTFNNRRGFTPELSLYREASAAVIRRLRGHPSLFMWCGGNEGPNPREELLARELLPQLDGRGQRPYLRSSDGDGLRGGGPYHNLLPSAYYGHPKLSGFNSEVGPSGVPEWESLRKFLGFEGDPALPGRFPLSGEWAYRNATDQAGSDPRKFSTYDSLLRKCFGSPAGTDLAAARGYVRRAQLVNHDAYQAAIESLNRGMGGVTTGFALWKFNASWPSLTWQISDWYLQPHAGFYSVRRACAPVHVQFSRDDRAVLLVNRGPAALTGVSVRASLHDSSGVRLWEETRSMAAPAGRSSASGLVVPAQDGLRFLRLEAVSAEGRVLSDNFYWLHPTDELQGLFLLPQATLRAAVTRLAPGRVRVELRNDGSVPAVLVRLRLAAASTRTELLPTYWSDNYTSLLPGESRGLEAEGDTNAAGGGPLVVLLDGENVNEQVCPVN